MLLWHQSLSLNFDRFSKCSNTFLRPWQLFMTFKALQRLKPSQRPFHDIFTFRGRILFYICSFVPESFLFLLQPNLNVISASVDDSVGNIGPDVAPQVLADIRRRLDKIKSKNSWWVGRSGPRDWLCCVRMWRRLSDDDAAGSILAIPPWVAACVGDLLPCIRLLFFDRLFCNLLQLVLPLGNS